jgi:methyl-accepting chemotaxis protein
MLVKIGIAPVVTVIMLLALAVVGVISQQRTTADLRRTVEVEMPASVRMQDISERITTAHGELYRLLTHQAASVDTKEIDSQMKALLAQLDATATDIAKIRDASDAADRPVFAQLLKQLSDTRSAIDLVGTMMGSDFATAAGFVAPFEDSYNQMNATLAKAVAAQRAKTAANAEASHARSETSILLTLIATGVTVLGAGVLTAYFVQTTRRSILSIAAATEQLAAGSTDLDLDRLQRKDELGAIVRSLMVFRDDQARLSSLQEDQKKTAALAEQERAAAEAERTAAAQQQAFVVGSVAKGLARLSDGDLVYRLDTPFAGEYEALRGDFNGAMARLQETMTVIAANTDGIRGGGEEISRAADDLSNRTEQQAARLEETAAALDEITATVKKTAEGAKEANRVVATAKGDAEHSGQVVSKAVEAMSAIEASSNQISQIIGVIDEIAFQTNLLALNAGVEAARAGDAGRGFAVVASEVRALAQRSAAAAKEIKALISASSQQVGAGVELVGETGKSLQRIVMQVNQISAVVVEIAASAQEQAAGLAEVNTAVNQMDQMTQQNAAMVQQSTAASHAMAEEADDLARLVGQFKLGDADRTATRAPAPKQYSPPQETRPALKTVGRGGAALKPQRYVALAGKVDSWDAF